MTATTEIDRVRTLVEPIASDLQLDLYDIERRGGTIRITLDAPSGSGITLDEISLATRLISREMDHEDPIPGHYTLEVTSPGIERPLRTADHFRREIGKDVTVRLRDVVNDERRVEGKLTAADEAAVTVRLASGEDRTIAYDSIDKARTVIDWTSDDRPGKKRPAAPGPAAEPAIDPESGGTDKTTANTIAETEETHPS
jgi:ribosome maturation factor RimP